MLVGGWWLQELELELQQSGNVQWLAVAVAEAARSW